MGDESCWISAAPRVASSVPAAVGADVHAASVVRVRCAHEKAALLGAIDQSGDGRFVQSQIDRELAHFAPAVAKDRQDAQLSEGDFMLGGDRAEHGRGDE